VLDELQAVEQRILARMSELRPALAEYQELEAAAARLGLDVTSGPATGRRSNGRHSTSSSKRAAAAQRPGGTRATGAERRQRVLDLIGGRPGITVPEISDTLGVDPPPLYRVVRKLQADGLISKEGKSLQLR